MRAPVFPILAMVNLPPCAGLCFGAGLGITLFGISYMFIHDGLVHRRFPVGPIAEARSRPLYHPTAADCQSKPQQAVGCPCMQDKRVMCQRKTA